MRRIFTIFSSCALAITMGASPALAAPVLRLEGGGLTTTIVDNGVGDLSPLSGVVVFAGSVGNFLLNVSTGISSRSFLGSDDQPYLSLSSVDLTTTGGTLTISFSDTGFLPLAQPTSYTSGLAGLVNSNGAVKESTYLDSSNTSFGTGTLLSTQTYGPGLFSGVVTSAGLATTSPFSLTQVVTLSLAGPGYASFNADLRAVPEPASLLLFGSGLVGIAAWAKRARPKPTT